ncbi:hypothetical protein Tco_1335021 [Tanacetum coccineum]
MEYMMKNVFGLSAQRCGDQQPEDKTNSHCVVQGAGKITPMVCNMYAQSLLNQNTVSRGAKLDFQVKAGLKNIWMFGQCVSASNGLLESSDTATTITWRKIYLVWRSSWIKCNTLTGFSTVKIHNKKLVQTLLKGTATLVLGGQSRQEIMK